MRISPEARRYLACKSHEEIDQEFDAWSSQGLGQLKSSAFEYIVTCPLSELPRYVNHPSEVVKATLKIRLSGADVMESVIIKPYREP